MIDPNEAEKMSEGDLVHASQKAWEDGNPNLAADYVSVLRGVVGARGASVEQDGNGKVTIVEPAA